MLANIMPAHCFAALSFSTNASLNSAGTTPLRSNSCNSARVRACRQNDVHCLFMFEVSCAYYFLIIAGNCLQLVHYVVRYAGNRMQVIVTFFTHNFFRGLDGSV